MNEAQDAYAAQLKDAGLVLCLGSMLHSIATGNMAPSWIKFVCVDINPGRRHEGERSRHRAGGRRGGGRGHVPRSARQDPGQTMSKYGYTGQARAARASMLRCPRSRPGRTSFETGYEIEIVIPEFTSVCPKTGLPDFGEIDDPLRARPALPRAEISQNVLAGLPRPGDLPGEHRQPLFERPGGGDQTGFWLSSSASSLRAAAFIPR